MIILIKNLSERDRLENLMRKAFEVYNGKIEENNLSMSFEYCCRLEKLMREINN